MSAAERLPDDAPQSAEVSVSMLVRALAEAENAREANNARRDEANREGLRIAARIGEIASQLASLVSPGISVTVKVSGAEAITVTMPPPGVRSAPGFMRSRIVR